MITGCPQPAMIEDVPYVVPFRDGPGVLLGARSASQALGVVERRAVVPERWQKGQSFRRQAPRSNPVCVKALIFGRVEAAEVRVIYRRWGETGSGFAEELAVRV